MAKQFGATDLVNATNGDPVAQVQELTGGRGVDVSFEVIGLKDTVQQAFAMARRGGQAIIVGVPKMEQIMEIPIAMELLVNEKQVRGSWYGSSDVQRDVPRLVSLYKDGTLKLDELVSRAIEPRRHQRRVHSRWRPARSPDRSSDYGILELASGHASTPLGSQRSRRLRGRIRYLDTRHRLVGSHRRPARA